MKDHYSFELFFYKRDSQNTFEIFLNVELFKNNAQLLLTFVVSFLTLVLTVLGIVIVF